MLTDTSPVVRAISTTLSRLASHERSLVILTTDTTFVSTVAASTDLWKRVIVPESSADVWNSRVHTISDLTLGLSFESQIQSAVLSGLLRGILDPTEEVVIGYWDGVVSSVTVVLPANLLKIQWQMSAVPDLGDRLEVAARLIDAGIYLSSKRQAAMVVCAHWHEVEPFLVPEFFNPFANDRPRLDTAHGLQTLAKFARTDCAIYVTPEGEIARLLAHVAPTASRDPKAQLMGLGSRHMTALELSACTAALVLTVQASDGTIRLWLQGDDVVRLRRA